MKHHDWWDLGIHAVDHNRILPLFLVIMYRFEVDYTSWKETFGAIVQIICLFLVGEREIPHQLQFMQLPKTNPRHWHIPCCRFFRRHSEVTKVACVSRPCHINSKFEALQYEPTSPNAWPVYNFRPRFTMYCSYSKLSSAVMSHLIVSQFDFDILPL